MAKKQKKSEEGYKLSLVVANKVFKAEGPSIQECVDNLNPDQTKSMGKLKLEFGSKAAEVLFPPLLVRRMRFNAVSRMLLAKRLSILLK